MVCREILQQVNALSWQSPCETLPLLPEVFIYHG